jgi:AcrR family transcriptional regulator
LPSDTRKKMIESAVILLATRGLQGTAFSDVVERSGAPRGSIYHHFPAGKDELVEAAVQLAGDRALGVLDAVEGQSPRAVTAFFLDVWREVLVRSGLRAGCAVLAVTVATDSPELLEHASAVFRAWRTRLAELYVQGGLPPDQAARLAATLVASSEGAVVLRRAERTLEPFELVAAELLSITPDRAQRPQTTGAGQNRQREVEGDADRGHGRDG